MSNVYGQCSSCGGSLTIGHVCPDKPITALGTFVGSRPKLPKALTKDTPQPEADLVAEIAQYIANHDKEEVTGFDLHTAQLIVDKVEPVIRSKIIKEIEAQKVPHEKLGLGGGNLKDMLVFNDAINAVINKLRSE